VNQLPLANKPEHQHQGDQIGRIFAQGSIVYFGQFSKNYTGNFWLILPKYILCTSFDKKWVGLHFKRHFSQTHLVTLISIHVQI
jgi:hypothetical protein